MSDQETVFHLKNYGDVSKSELEELTAAKRRPYAWAHDDGKEIHVITDKIKRIWLDANEIHVEHYNIPLYREPPK